MIELETKVAKPVNDHILNWNCYIDNKVGYVKNMKVEYVLEKLNGFSKILSLCMSLKKKTNYHF